VISTILVVAVIGSIASRTILTAVEGYTRASTQAQLHTELSIAMDRIERELRKMPRKPPSAIVAPDISSVTVDSLAWGANYSLALAGTQVQFVENGAAAVALVDDVSAFTVQAFDESNSVLAPPLTGTACDAIRRIAISISIQRYGVTETVTSKVYLRCTMEGAPME
jgi:hypothetical protein